MDIADPDVGDFAARMIPIIRYDNYGLVTADSAADFHTSNHRSFETMNAGSDSIL
jgi:hypothetical protein